MGTNRELLEHYVELYNAGDLDGVMGLYAEDAVQIMPEGIFSGKTAIRERLDRDVKGFTDLTYKVESFVGQGDTFADEWSMVGTHTAPIALPNGTELPATGRRVQMRGMEFVRVRDGKIVTDNLYYDNVALMAQLSPVQLDTAV